MINIFKRKSPQFNHFKKKIIKFKKTLQSFSEIIKSKYASTKKLIKGMNPRQALDPFPRQAAENSTQKPNLSREALAKRD
jgi:hypothetical protein